MIQRAFNILQNRNVILISALIAAFLIPGGGQYLSDYTIYLLALVMSFSTTGIQFKMLVQIKSVSKFTLESFLLNYLLHGAIILLLAYFIADDASFLGFVVIAATPPGVAIIPFTYSFKGDLDYSFKGILGTYLLSIILTPLIISVFAKDASLNSEVLLFLIIKILVIPILVSRILLHKKIYPFVDKIRGKVVDYGFALIIYTAVSLNHDLLLSDFQTVLISSVILFAAIFVSGAILLILQGKNKFKQKNISRNLMLTIKGSGFAVATTLVLFEQKSAVPAAVMSVLVLLYLLSMNLFYGKR
jgi:BASS family bile acid:Na+ symporter